MIGGYSSESIHVQIFHLLLDVIQDLLTIDDGGISEVAGMLPLHFDVVSRTTTKLIIVLGHSRAESAGVVIDPEMTIAIHMDRGMAEALTYRDAYIVDAVYSPDGSHIDILTKRVNNDYLHTWLGNLIVAGHSIKATEDHD